MNPRIHLLPLVAAVISIGAAQSAQAAAGDDLVIDVGGISFEELINTTITSVSKREERLQDAAAAVYVLTNEDIRRSHVTNIPDALRLVPGVEVTQTSASSWGVSIRGFNTGVFANKLLVLIDGRSVYDPLFSGTFWQVQDVMLEDIERIEVVRGPGGTLWGANAVNGVINITTKAAGDTRGGLVAVGTGSEERAYSGLRYGWDLGSGRHLRVYGKFNERDESFSQSLAQDDWRMGRGGFRFDSVQAAGSFTLQGDIYDGRSGTTNRASATLEDTRFYGGNVLGRWERRDAEGGAYALQVYWDYTDYDAPSLEQQRNTWDIDFQRTHAQNGAHAFTWGGGYRLIEDDVSVLGFLTPVPARATDRIFSLFGQDQIAVTDALSLTAGVKFENNDYTGWEVQPNVRVSWAVDADTSVWAAVSKAIRTPSRLESDFTVIGNDHLEAEKVVAYELGLRQNFGRKLRLDATAFVNDYDQLIIFQDVNGLQANNALEGTAQGLELTGDWLLSKRWTLETQYTYLQLQLKPRGGQSTSQVGVPQDSAIEDAVAEHRVNLISRYDIRDDLKFDATLRYVDNIPSPPTGAGASTSVDAYTVMDLGLIWVVSSDLDVALSARNLLDDHHPEAPTAGRNEIQHSVMGKVTWKF